jgi:hypothetical protein
LASAQFPCLKRESPLALPCKHTSLTSSVLLPTLSLISEALPTPLGYDIIRVASIVIDLFCASQERDATSFCTLSCVLHLAVLFREGGQYWLNVWWPWKARI